MVALVDGYFRDGGDEEVVFAKIAQELEIKGYAVIPAGLPDSMITLLADQAQTDHDSFIRAKIGRGQDTSKNSFVRRDKIAWIDGVTHAEKLWLAWNERLKIYLNRRLMLGLFSYECHFAHYEPGDFYKKHLDAFKGEANRILSTVLYLNPGWLPDDGGELQIYDDADQPLIKVTPAYGSLVVFLSEEFPHEVLPAKRNRFSIAGWYRLNQSMNGVIDPQF